MKLWLISQDDNGGYDTYDSAVVAAESIEGARQISPDTYDYGEKKGDQRWGLTWASSPDKVQVKLIGEAIPGTQPGVIVASFNAG
jgi:hypothetical protein